MPLEALNHTTKSSELLKRKSSDRSEASVPPLNVMVPSTVCAPSGCMDSVPSAQVPFKVKDAASRSLFSVILYVLIQLQLWYQLFQVLHSP